MSELNDPIDQEKNAIDLIARTPEGVLLNRFLRRILETVVEDESDSTLRTTTGRRSLARDLMRLMAEGIKATSVGRSSSDSDSILGGQRKPIDTSGRSGGTRRRVTVERGDGWLPDSAYDDAGNRKPS